MPRKPRVEFEGAIYHIMSRGNRGDAIFLDDKDRETFIDTLDEACTKTGWLVHAFVLMGNHYLCGAPHNQLLHITLSPFVGNASGQPGEWYEVATGNFYSAI
jgi:hypothetical protein